MVRFINEYLAAVECFVRLNVSGRVHQLFGKRKKIQEEARCSCDEVASLHVTAITRRLYLCF